MSYITFSTRIDVLALWHALLFQGYLKYNSRELQVMEEFLRIKGEVGFFFLFRLFLELYSLSSANAIL